jgi:sec-independent protein translocase protein TatA
MFGLGVPELLIILALVLVIFGPRRLKNIGSELGNAIKGFRTAVKEEPESQAEEKVIEGQPQQAETAETKQDQRV